MFFNSIILLYLYGYFVSFVNIMIRKECNKVARSNFYPYPSYSKKIYYRKIDFGFDGLGTVYNNFGKIEEKVNFDDMQNLDTTNESFLGAIRDCIHYKRTFRIHNNAKQNLLYVYAENCLIPTHIFCLLSDIKSLYESKSIKEDFLIIKTKITNFGENESNFIDMVGFFIFLVHEAKLDGYVFGKHGKYFVIWYEMNPILLVNIKENDMVSNFLEKNPCLVHISSNWKDATIMGLFEDSSLFILTKHKTPSNLFEIKIKKKIDTIVEEYSEKMIKSQKKAYEKFKMNLKLDKINKIDLNTLEYYNFSKTICDMLIEFSSNDFVFTFNHKAEE